jgi:AcrR family transcriptional regulator
MSTVATPKARGPYRNGVKRRREIIEAAADVFGKYGYAGGSLRQIAEVVGVTPAALTRHFNGKEGLLIAVLEYWDAGADRVMVPHHGLDRFKYMPISVWEHTLDRGLIEMFLTVAAEASNPSHPINGFVRLRYERVMNNAIWELKYAREAGQVLWMSDEQIESEVRGTYALMDGIQLQWLLNPSLDVVAMFKYYLGMTISRWIGREFDWSEAPDVPPRTATSLR